MVKMRFLLLNLKGKDLVRVENDIGVIDLVVIFDLP